MSLVLAVLLTLASLGSQQAPRTVEQTVVVLDAHTLRLTWTLANVGTTPPTVVNGVVRSYTRQPRADHTWTAVIDLAMCNSRVTVGDLAYSRSCAAYLPVVVR